MKSVYAFFCAAMLLATGASASDNTQVCKAIDDWEFDHAWYSFVDETIVCSYRSDSSIQRRSEGHGPICDTQRPDWNTVDRDGFPYTTCTTSRTACKFVCAAS